MSANVVGPGVGGSSGDGAAKSIRVMMGKPPLCRFVYETSLSFAETAVE